MALFSLKSVSLDVRLFLGCSKQFLEELKLYANRFESLRCEMRWDEQLEFSLVLKKVGVSKLMSVVMDVRRDQMTDEPDPPLSCLFWECMPSLLRFRVSGVVLSVFLLKVDTLELAHDGNK